MSEKFMRTLTHSDGYNFRISQQWANAEVYPTGAAYRQVKYPTREWKGSIERSIATGWIRVERLIDRALRQAVN